MSTSLQTVLDLLVDKKAAPGIVACTFDASGKVLENVAAGKVTTDTIFWQASTSKFPVSLVSIIVAQKHKIDLDSHEALVKIVPELGRDFPGTRIWDIVDGKDADGKWKFKKAQVGITLRHILSHTSGSAYFFNSEYDTELFMSRPEEEKTMGSLVNMNVPRRFEAGTNFHYGGSCDYLPVFVTRLAKMSFRRALQKYLLEPLNVPEQTLDCFRTPKMNARRAELSMLLDPASDTFGPSPVPFDTPQYEDYGEPDPEKYFAFGSAPLWGEMSSMAIIFAACLGDRGPVDHRTGEPLISADMWAQCTEDALAVRYNLSIGQSAETPFLLSTLPPFSDSINVYKKYKGGDEGDNSIGWTILQCLYLRRESETGLQSGTLAWAGLANTYYFIDRKQGFGGVITAQFFPFGSQRMLEARDELEKWAVAQYAK